MTGIHHITAITNDVQDNVNFWMGFLGMRLVKKTAGYEDEEQLHLFYGDAEGSPGSLVSFLVWQDGGRGRVGHGQVVEISLAIPIGRTGDWLTRCLEYRVPVEGPVREFNETVLRIRDPDGIIVKLVGKDLPSGNWPSPPERLCGTTLWSEDPSSTVQFLSDFQYTVQKVAGGVTRLQSTHDVIDVRDASGFVSGIPGGGIIDHVALALPDVEELEKSRRKITEKYSPIVNIHDRKYFSSLYVREPSGILIELATLGPGFTVDESLEELGTTLMVPPHVDEEVADLQVRMPQFLQPGEPGLQRRHLSFIHRLYVPEDSDDSVLVLFHGSGGHETDLFSFARQLSPKAILLGVRGRALEEGTPRYFRRSSSTNFDQEDILAEALAAVHFLADATSAYGLEESTMTFVGYSNGGNFLSALAILHPDSVKRAIVLRGTVVLEDIPDSNLTGTNVLLVHSPDDKVSTEGEALTKLLGELGASVAQVHVSGGHQIGSEDVVVAKEWLQKQQARSTEDGSKHKGRTT